MSKNIHNSTAYNAGFKQLTYNNEDKTLISLWYPTKSEEQIVHYWLWQGNAAQDAMISNSIFPLLIFSHGMGGNMHNQYYLAEFMARNGYIVAAVNHYDKAHSFQTLTARPHHITRALDLILNDVQINYNINRDQIGMLGHSLGGYTAFAIAGGRPDFSKYISLYFSALSNNYLYSGKITEFLTKIYVDSQGFENSFYDARVKAIAVLAPGLGKLFDHDSLSKVTIAVFIMEAEKDEVVDGNNNALLYKANLPQPPQYSLLKGAGHYAFLPICSNQHIMRVAPHICYDPEIKREILHITIQQQVLGFFDDTF